MPSVDGGMQQLFQVMAKRIKYPKNDNYPIESKVFVAFVVTELGDITGQRIVKNIEGTDLAEQLLEVVSEFKWLPGTCNGKQVPTILILPMIIDVK